MQPLTQNLSGVNLKWVLAVKNQQINMKYKTYHTNREVCFYSTFRLRIALSRLDSDQCTYCLGCLLPKMLFCKIPLSKQIQKCPYFRLFPLLHGPSCILESVESKKSYITCLPAFSWLFEIVSITMYLENWERNPGIHLWGI